MKTTTSLLMALLVMLMAGAGLARAGGCSAREAVRNGFKGGGELGPFVLTSITIYVPITAVSGTTCLTERAFGSDPAPAQAFLDTNAERIAAEAARGGGEWTASLALLLGCPAEAQPQVAGVLGRDLAQWMAVDAEDVGTVGERALRVLGRNAALHHTCAVI